MNEGTVFARRTRWRLRPADSPPAKCRRPPVQVAAAASVQIEARAHALADAFRLFEIVKPGIEERTLVGREIANGEPAPGVPPRTPGSTCACCRRCQCGAARPAHTALLTDDELPLMQTPIESLRCLLVSMNGPELASPSAGRAQPRNEGQREGKYGRSARALVYANLDLLGNPAIHELSVRTGGFASPSFDGFAKTSARSVRRQKSLPIYI